MLSQCHSKRQSLPNCGVLCHSCWWALVDIFCFLSWRAARHVYYIHTLNISFIYSMYIYSCIHIWRAARNVKNPPANNYVLCLSRLMFSSQTHSEILKNRSTKYRRHPVTAHVHRYESTKCHHAQKNTGLLVLFR